MPLKKHALALGAAGALVLSLSACSTGSAESAEDGTVTVGTLRAQPHLFTPFLYESFAPEGLEFEVVLFDSSTDIKNAVVSGSVDFGVTGASSVLSGISQGQDVTVVASSADGGTRIVASEGVETPEDLVGKKVGYPMGATQEILLKQTLDAAGIDPATDVELVNLPFAEMANAYGSGQIDAFISAEIGPSVAIEAGAHELMSPYETGIGRTNIVLATTGALVEENPDLVQQVVDTHAAATEHLLADPDAWASGLVEEFGLDEAVVRTAIENIWPRWEIDAAYQATLEAMNDEMVAFDQLGAPADPAALTDTTFTDAVTVG
ncbi:ABC transporter substrate-binding protein [Cellulosimicrobium marinum]|uniref:ABC transporter substrate-binding protein n=1 Tax=Cellulosimicrobium marinum TaxID=1638992 RepID=UPI001E4C4263|nr:ABC transporter substrate-binding protein [Cellulosimicrobium marinum]MCB7135315.1 ABC transporter substrate-binding protein [Cellulosimicrobium marinum]